MVGPDAGPGNFTSSVDTTRIFTYKTVLKLQVQRRQACC